jgi:FdhD protein
LCGKATIDAVHARFEPVESDVTVDAATLLALPEKLRGGPGDFDRTGGLHGAALFTAAGELLVAREDVGPAQRRRQGARLGAAERAASRSTACVARQRPGELRDHAEGTGGARAGRGGVSAPSSLAVEFADDSGMTLVGFLREGRMNVYSEPGRVRFA